MTDRAAPPEHLDTGRLRLRPWRIEDRSAFYELNADPEVSADLGGPLTQAASDRKLDKYIRSFDERGVGRWLVERYAADSAPEFIGYAGVMESSLSGPLGTHYDIGWRLLRHTWGHGYATEAATAALSDAFERCKLAEVFAYTAENNIRSQAVMGRLGLVRAATLDFTVHFGDVGEWHGLVWVAHRKKWAPSAE